MLLLMPSANSKFLAHWQVQFKILEWVGPANYRLEQLGKKKKRDTQLYHVDLIIIKKVH